MHDYKTEELSHITDYSYNRPAAALKSGYLLSFMRFGKLILYSAQIISNTVYNFNKE
jgi:hypothetical protein